MTRIPIALIGTVGLFALATSWTAHAGDILRGGAPAGGRAPASGGGVTSAEAARARTNAQDALSRTTQALQSVQRMQDAARAAAQGRNHLGADPKHPGQQLPTVPNGLRPGGLEVAPGVGVDPSLWRGAQLPRAVANNVIIKQTAAQAVLNWKTFNVGKETTLTFDQSQGGARQREWIAFNKGNDPSGRPSQILGAITAQGQVYLINQNGILFGGSAQLNLHTLVASTLPINDNLLSRGLLNNPDAQFLFSALPLAAGSKGTPAFNPTISDRAFTVSAGAETYTLAEQVALDSGNAPLKAPVFTFQAADGSRTKLVAGTDYTLAVAAATRKATATFTAAGLQKVGAGAVQVSYTPVVVKSGDVVVQAGATITSPASADGNGGRVMLVGANVKNEGTISTPSGQTILAAGLQAGIVAHRSDDPSLRGLDTFVGAVTAAGVALPPAGTATNLGLIDVPRGNVSMIGRTVQQLSVIESSTSTALNGRIDLLADYGTTSNPNFDATNPGNGPAFLIRSSGSVEIGPGSVSRILPELDGTDRAVGTQLALPSRINIEGQTIHFAADSQILAPSASVTVSAGKWFENGIGTTLKYTGGQIYFDSGALLNVAGSVEIAAPISENILTLQLRGAELANSPLQRTGLLRGPTITVDARQSGTYHGMAWVGTPLGDVSGYVGLIQRSVGELTTAGGTVAFNAGEAVIMQPGSVVDVSGGWINYEGGLVQTTRVLAGGVLYDLAQATPDRIYDGIYTGTTTFTHPKYGITETYTQPLALTGAHYEQSYLQGAKAGSIAITAPSMALDGTLRGQAVRGPRQENATTLAPATGGSLALTFQANKSDDATKPAYAAYSPTPPEIVFDALATLPEAGPFALREDGTAEALREERKKKVSLSPELLAASGFASLAIDNSDGTISLPADTALNAPLRGSISLRAANLDLAGKVTAPGGSLSFSVFNVSPFTVAELTADSSNQHRVTPLADPDRGVFTLGPTATLSTAGRIVDHRPGTLGAADAPPLIDAGTITINTFTAKLAAGSVIDVSGGVSISATGKRSYGAGGSIVINAGREPNPDLNWLLGGRLALGSTLRGFSGGQGGSLSIQAPLMQIGGPRPVLVPSSITSDPKVEPFYVIKKTKVGRDELLYLTPEFFTQGGFSSFTLNGIGKATAAGSDPYLTAITIAPGTIIRPTAESLLAVPGAGAGPVTLQPFLKPEGLRTPVSLNFGTSGTQDRFTGINTIRGDFVLGAGAAIETEPRGSVTIQGDTIAILGSILAPGGGITLSGAGSFPTLGASGQTLALPTVDLGPRSVLSTAGRILLTPDDPYGRRVGAVLAGGTITVSGNIVAEAGALLDVSGASGTLDLPPASLIQNIPIGDAESSYRQVAFRSGLTAPLDSIRTVPTRVDSDAGAIILRGAQELFTDATLRGFAGGPSARGGSLTISSERFYDPQSSVAPTPLDINLIVTQSGLTLPAAFYPAGATAIGQLVPVATGNAGLGLGHFAADSFLQGGFDALTLSGGSRGAVSFSGPVSISARRSLSIADGGVIFADAAVLLEAPYLAFGTPFETPLLATQAARLSFPGPAYFSPTFGPGSLTVRASLLDLGKLSLQNIGRAAFLADDVRGNGTLDVAGTITFRAGQLYPTTASQFTIAAYDPNILVSASSSGSNLVTLASAVLPPGFGVGSPLLGTKVAAIAGTHVTLEANANATINAKTAVAFAPGRGSVTIIGSGTRPLPLSAGGTLSIYASNITQGGTLRAPLGTINLGWDGTGTSPTDYLFGAGLVAGKTVPVTQHLTLASGSVTSVSAIDPSTGTAMLIPYGFSADGNSWIDPTGTDISAGGVPGKAVNLSALNLSDQAGSLIDVRGGGDLYAYRWVTGNGGTNDLLGTASAAWDTGKSYTAGQLVSYQGATWSARQANQGSAPAVGLNWTLVPQSFAILPSYEAGYAPFAPFNNVANALNLAVADPGYVSKGLAVGDRITLGASSGLSAGTYTLLPARYALLPGAVLVTPQTGAPVGTFLFPEGSSIVAGYRFNGLNDQQLPPAAATRFEVLPGEVLRTRARYDDFLANDFLAQSARRLGTTVPRLPLDSGRVVFSGLNSLQLDGQVAGRSLAGGHGAQIDISSLADIFITGSGGVGPAGSVVLDAARLSGFGAESLLIGGIRLTTPTGTTLTVKTGNVTVANAGTPLTAPEIILVAKTGLTLAPGAQIVQSGSTHGGSSGDASTLRSAMPPSRAAAMACCCG